MCDDYNAAYIHRVVGEAMCRRNDNLRCDKRSTTVANPTATVRFIKIKVQFYLHKMANEKIIICFHLPRPCVWSSVTTPNNASNFVQVFQTSVRIERGVTVACEAEMSTFLLQISFIF